MTIISIIKRNIVAIFLLATFAAPLVATVAMTDFSYMLSETVEGIKTPQTIDALKKIVQDKGPFAIAGGKFSQGGHIWHKNGHTIDMKHLQKILNIDPIDKTVTVQAGATWRQVQHAIDPYNLSVKTMQSYADFSIGGSLSVNVHGRDIAYGPLIDTVLSIKILVADGTEVTASRSENSDIFYGAIGGYGALGIITEATLSLTDNYPVEQIVQEVAVADYAQFFKEHIKENPNIALHNANLYPHDFDKVLSIAWVKTDNPLTCTDRLSTPKMVYPKEWLALFALRFDIAKSCRLAAARIVYSSPAVVWRNYEMGESTTSLKPALPLPITSSILQEYFIPIEHYQKFIDGMKSLINTWGINVINVSIRYITPDKESLLAYAPQEAFSFVMYLKVTNTQSGKHYAKHWTRKLIDLALSLNGTYYLPYYPFATQAQFKASYPRYEEFLELKHKIDPTNKFSNTFINHYLLS